MSRGEDRPPSSPRCDECERTGVKIVRKFRGHRYCRTCYGRMFKRKLCPKCGNFARLPVHITNAVCRSCERSRPCVRCGRTMTRVGKMTAYGPACGRVRALLQRAGAVRGMRDAFHAARPQPAARTRPSACALGACAPITGPARPADGTDHCKRVPTVGAGSVLRAASRAKSLARNAPEPCPPGADANAGTATGRQSSSNAFASTARPSHPR